MGLLCCINHETKASPTVRACMSPLSTLTDAPWRGPPVPMLQPAVATSTCWRAWSRPGLTYAFMTRMVSLCMTGLTDNRTNGDKHTCWPSLRRCVLWPRHNRDVTSCCSGRAAPITTSKTIWGNMWCLDTCWIITHDWCCAYNYTPAQRSWRGGILDSPCPSVCPSVRPSVCL